MRPIAIGLVPTKNTQLKGTRNQNSEEKIISFLIEFWDESYAQTFGELANNVLL